jgi:hypothetical protein
MLEKQCTKCFLSFSVEMFNWKNKEKEKRQSCCKSCQRIAQKIFYTKKISNKPKKISINKIPDGVLIDEDDRDFLEKVGKWYVSDKGYVRKTFRIKNEKDKSVFMHRYIWQNAFGEIQNKMQIDHINGNRLDNRKDNLRLVTNQENQWNQTKARGYHWHPAAKKWLAQIGFNDQIIDIGFFDKEEDARNAYLEAKKIYHVIPERKQNATDSSNV